MKKLFLYIFLGLICFTTSYGSDALKGLHTLDLTIEETTNKVCGVTKKDIERKVKFILSNTPIKLKKDISIETIYIAPTIINASSSCSGYAFFEIWQGGYMKNSVGNKYFGKQILYDKGYIYTNKISSFKDGYLNVVGDLTKDFVIKWREVN